MRRKGGPTIEIETLAELDQLVEAGARRMRGWQVQDVDLTERDDVLLRLDPAGALFLGCTISPQVADGLRKRGALIFPSLPDVPFDAYRSQLYTPEQLYAGLEDGYEGTLDARIYAWSRGTSGSTAIRDTLGPALHDNAIDDALVEFIGSRHVVGVMGGHDLRRDDPAYADTARLGHDLAGRGLTVATGGGPGAMEAANLGARLANEPVAILEATLTKAAAVPTFRPSVTAWARAAFEAVDGLSGSGRSLGIPTWFYGHEPPNPFCVRIAKYFKNAIREDVLLHVCRSGIVFLPGAAGTVQEVFQSACENYYAEPGAIAPMVLYDSAYWTSRLPAWPLLEAMAHDRAMAGSVHLVDRLDDVLELFDA